MRLKTVIPAIAGLVFGAVVLRQLLGTPDADTQTSEFDTSAIIKALDQYGSSPALESAVNAWVQDTASAIVERQGLSNLLVITSDLHNIDDDVIKYQVHVLGAETGTPLRKVADYKYKIDFAMLIAPSVAFTFQQFIKDFEDKIIRYKQSKIDWGHVRKWQTVEV